MYSNNFFIKNVRNINIMSSIEKTKKQGVKLDRNNTSFFIQLLEYFKTLKWGSEYDFLKYYQNIIRIFINDVNIDARGILVTLSMGMGKSLSAIAIAMEMINERPVILLLNKSLQANMRASIHKYIALRGKNDPEYWLAKKSHDEIEKWIDMRFSFVAMNASNMTKQMADATDSGFQEFDAALDKRYGDITHKMNLDGKLLIIDEAHNLFRAIVNDSKNAIELYEKIKQSKNLKIVFLTGTPISNDPYELAVCFNMLGSRYPNVAIMPESYVDFNSFFVNADGTLKNKNKFQNRIAGLVSFVDHKSTPGAALGVKLPQSTVKFPTVRETVVVKSPMHEYQYSYYQLARDKEKSEASYGGAKSGSYLAKPKSATSSTYHVKSSQLSNFCPPGGNFNLDVIPDDYLKSGKLDKLMELLKAELPGTHSMLYSRFVSLGGLQSVARWLELNGMKRWVGNAEMSKKVGSFDISSAFETAPSSGWWNNTHGADEKGDPPAKAAPAAPTPAKRTTELSGYYAMITGEIDVDEREEIMNVYNDKRNLDGSVIKMLLISSTGAEGLDLKRTNYIYHLEPYWTYGRHLQVSARGARNDSHIDLSEDLQFVQNYIFIAVPPADREHLEPTTDEEMYERAIASKRAIDGFVSAIREVSIECLLNKEANCRICMPDNQPLFTDNFYNDMKLNDPCKETKETTVKATEIEIDGKTYYYVTDKTTLYGIKVYTTSGQKGVYTRLKESDPEFMAVVTALKLD